MAITKLSDSGIATGGVLKYDSMLAGNAAFIPSDFESIATVTVGSGGSLTITFSSIPSDYTHLQVRGLMRTDRASTTDYLYIRFNSDTGSNYAYHRLNGNGSSAGSDAGSSTTAIVFDRAGAASATSGIFGGFVMDILDYDNTNKYKVTRSLGGVDTNGGGEIHIESGLWQNTDAITTIDITSGTSSTFQQYSHFALYGIKEA
jgi:hypothetical protein